MKRRKNGGVEVERSIVKYDRSSIPEQFLVVRT
jgi:hypothetical protein